MNETLNSQNKSCYGSYHEKPNIELENFININNAKLDVNEEKLQSFNFDENIWNDAFTYKEISDKIVEEINLYCGDMAVIEGEIEYYKRKTHTRNENIASINQLIQECVVTFKELENEKSEFTQGIINKHTAIKQATKYYKKRLNIHISVEKRNETNFVKICLFTEKYNDQFSFVFSLNDNNETMKLESTKPKLNDTYFSQIQTKFKKDQNISALLSLIRKRFLALK